MYAMKPIVSFSNTINIIMTKSVSSSQVSSILCSLASYLKGSLLALVASTLLVLNPLFAASANSPSRDANEPSPASTKAEAEPPQTPEQIETKLRAMIAADEEKAAALVYVPQPVDVNSFLPAACKSAAQIPSLFLSEQQKVEAIEQFVRFVGIKCLTLHEGNIRKELKRRLLELGARDITPSFDDPNVPLNLVMELPATAEFKGRPGLILNAHMDTIPNWPQYELIYVPEEMDFDSATKEFFHTKEHSFGADDRAGVSVLLSALEAAYNGYYKKGIGHRRIVILLTAQEELGARGAEYLTEEHPEVFRDVEISLTTDGPLDYRKEYPENSYIVVVEEEKSRILPFSQIVRFVDEISTFKDVSFTLTTEMGGGDFTLFPPEAKSDLHIRAPYQGDHSKERVKLDDLFNHIDLFTYILLRLDGVPLQLNKDMDRLQLAEPVNDSM